MDRRRKEPYRVNLVNLNSVNTKCGYAEGKTLEEAQRKALQIALDRGIEDARLSSTGREVLFTGAVYC